MLNYIVAPDKLIYAEVPGCGSKTVLGWAVCIQRPDLYNNHSEYFNEIRKMTGVEYKEFKELIPNKGWNEINSMKYWWFTIVKDPVERFVDNYRSRVLHHQKTGQTITSISDFIDRFDEITKKENDTKGLRWWFKPQSFHLDNLPEWYEKIFNVNQMDQVKAYIEQKTGKTLPDFHLNRIPDSIERPVLTPAQVDWIKEKYKEDYKFYGKWF